MHNRLFLLAVGLATACSSGSREETARAADSSAATPVTTAAEPPASAATGTHLAYVTNEDSRELSVVDVATSRVLATIEVGTRPRGVRATTDGRTVFVALSGSPRCPPSMPDAECEKLQADKSKDGVAVVDAVSRKV